MTHCLGRVQLASCGPWNVNISQLIAVRVELNWRCMGWRGYKLVIAVVEGGVILCDDLPALEDEIEETYDEKTMKDCS